MPIAADSPAALAQASRLLQAGELVAFPTETVYGLGADATNDRAVAAIYAAKGRPSFNPLIAHVADTAAAAELVELDVRAHLLARHFWPGPLTLVLPRRAGCPVSLLASSGLDSLAVRVPAHPLALALLHACGRPLAAPSANPSGAISPTTATHVDQGLGTRVALVLDGGACAVGIESTILDLTETPARLLRPGGLAVETLEALIGPVARLEQQTTPDAPRAPGLLTSHYAPGLPVRLNARTAEPGEALLGFGSVAGAVLNLSPSACLNEAAANLFAYLRRLDQPHQYRAIAVSPIPLQGLGLGINDRLTRAAAPREPHSSQALP